MNRTREQAKPTKPNKRKQKMREKNANRLLKRDQNDFALQNNCDLK